MRIAIASDDQRTLATHFGRAAGFLVYDLQGETPVLLEYRENRVRRHGQTDSGPAVSAEDHHARVIENLRDCRAVLCRGMGRRMIQNLARAGMEAWITDEEDAQTAAAALLRGHLVNHQARGCSHSGCGEETHNPHS